MGREIFMQSSRSLDPAACKKCDENKNEILNTPNSLSSKAYCIKLQFYSGIYSPMRKKRTNVFRRVNAAILNVFSSQKLQKWAKKYQHLLQLPELPYPTHCESTNSG